MFTTWGAMKPKSRNNKHQKHNMVPVCNTNKLRNGKKNTKKSANSLKYFTKDTF